MDLSEEAMLKWNNASVLITLSLSEHSFHLLYDQDEEREYVIFE